MAYSNWVANRRIINLSITSGPIVQSEVSGIPDGSGQNRVFSYNGITPWTGDSNAYSSVETKLFLNGVIDGTDYDNLSHNNAISMRAKLKIGGVGSNTSITQHGFRWGIGLSAYSPQITTEITSGVGSTVGGGYSLELIRRIVSTTGNPDTMGNYLVIKARKTPIDAITARETTSNVVKLDDDIVVTCSGTYLDDTWYHVRFDLIPTSLTTKVLTAYTSSDNGSTWNQVGTYTVDESMTSQWRSSGFIGFNSCFVYDMGTTPYNPAPGQEAKAYIGDFKINVDPINFIP